MKLNRYSFFYLLLVLCFACIAAQSNAQKGAIRGFVYEKKTGEPVLYASVYLKGTTTGTTTDVNGYFSLSNIAGGNYTLVATSIGYDTVTEAIALAKEQIITKKLYLQEAGVTMGTVEVSGESQRHKTNVDVGVTVITPEMMKQIPSIGGQA